MEVHCRDQVAPVYMLCASTCCVQAILVMSIYLFNETGVERMKWSLTLTRCHFQLQVIEGHDWPEMLTTEVNTILLMNQWSSTMIFS